MCPTGIAVGIGGEAVGAGDNTAVAIGAGVLGVAKVDEVAGAGALGS